MQLQTFLEGFFIDAAQLPEIRVTDRMALESYGIETAADVTDACEQCRDLGSGWAGNGQRRHWPGGRLSNSSSAMTRVRVSILPLSRMCASAMLSSGCILNRS